MTLPTFELDGPSLILAQRRRYEEQKRNAKRRGIDFLMSFPEWVKLWEDHWEERGRGKVMMCRHDDNGPYSVENCFIGTSSDNNKNMSGLNRAKLSLEEVSDIRLLLGHGVKGTLIQKEYGISSAQVSRIKTGVRW